jgi:myo-inositol-1(or 4)-monophosphatase
VVEMGWSARRPLAHSLDLITRMIADNIEFRRCGSGAMGLANVALGVSDGYVELHINAWDALAGLLLVREAGGWTNDFLADDGLRQGNVVVACTAELTERLLALEPLRGVA